MNPQGNQPTQDDPSTPEDGGNLVEDVTDLLEEVIEGL